MNNSLGNSKRQIYEEKNLRNLFNYEEDIFARHINEIDYIHLEDTDEENAVNDAEVEIVQRSNIVDPRIGMPVRNDSMVRDYTKLPTFHNRFNRKSLISEEDHMICMTALRYYQNTVSAIEDPAIKVAIERFSGLSFLIEAEVEQYREYAKRYFYTYSTKRMLYINDRIKNFIICDWKYKVNNMSLPVPDFSLYCFLNYTTDISEDIDLKVNKTDLGLFTLTGLVPASNFRDEWENMRCVLRDPAWVHNKMKKFEPSPMTNQTKELDSLINFHNLQIDIMISVDVFKAILSNRRRDQNFLLPLITKVVNKTKMAVIDVPLPPTSLHGYDNNRYAHNCAIKAIFTTIRCENALDIRTKEVSCMNNAGTLRISRKFKGYKLFKLSEDRTEASNSKTPLNYSYNRWALSKKNETLQLLVKSSIDFYEQADGNCAPKYYNLSTKIEYQPEFGAGAMTEEELVEEWCAIAFQPHQPAFIRRVRIDSETSMILSYRDLDLHQIEKDLLRLCNLRPQNLIDRIYYSIKSFKCLPPDNYIIQKTNKQYQNMGIFRQSPNIDSVKLCVKKMYDDMSLEYPMVQFVEYMELDDREISYHNNENDLLPCTFPYWKSIGPNRNKAVAESDSRKKKKTINSKFCEKRIVKPRNIKPEIKPDTKKTEKLETIIISDDEWEDIPTQQTERKNKVRSEKENILPNAGNKDVSTVSEASASNTASEDREISNKCLTKKEIPTQSKNNMEDSRTGSVGILSSKYKISDDGEDVYSYRNNMCRGTKAEKDTIERYNLLELEENVSTVHDESGSTSSSEVSDTDEEQSNAGPKEFASGYYSESQDSSSQDTYTNIKRKMSNENGVHRKPKKARKIPKIPDYFVDFYKRYVPSSEKKAVLEKAWEGSKKCLGNPKMPLEYNEIMNYMKNSKDQRNTNEDDSSTD